MGSSRTDRRNERKKYTGTFCLFFCNYITATVTHFFVLLFCPGHLPASDNGRARTENGAAHQSSGGSFFHSAFFDLRQFFPRIMCVQQSSYKTRPARPP